jgi:crotonobetainyl-CoA:carnitine CoA-transferase CaiB-like acyl-CoA transferase
MSVELPHPTIGAFKTTGLPVKLSETPGSIRHLPPAQGADTDAVLAEYGIDPEAVAPLRCAGVIRSGDT